MIICNEVGKKKTLENDEYSSVQIKQSQLATLLSTQDVMACHFMWGIDIDDKATPTTISYLVELT
jgi:hypothetical protein